MGRLLLLGKSSRGTFFIGPIKEIFPVQASTILIVATGGLLLSPGYICDKIFT